MNNPLSVVRFFLKMGNYTQDKRVLLRMLNPEETYIYYRMDPDKWVEGHELPQHPERHKTYSALAGLVSKNLVDISHDDDGPAYYRRKKTSELSNLKMILL